LSIDTLFSAYRNKMGELDDLPQSKREAVKNQIEHLYVKRCDQPSGISQIHTWNQVAGQTTLCDQPLAWKTPLTKRDIPWP